MQIELGAAYPPTRPERQRQHADSLAPACRCRRLPSASDGDALRQGGRPPPPRPGNDPPLDSISHRVQFIVALSGSLSSNWTLIKFRGPTQWATLALASRIRTHALGIVMASPRLNRANTNDFATEAFKLQMRQLIQTPVKPVQ